MTAPAIPAPAPKGCLGNGQLRRQVAEWLAARPGPHTVGEIAKDLSRSAGAVGNALTTLADRGEASRIAGKPLRYEANSATAAAVAAITPKAPSPPKAAPAAPSAALKSAAPPASPAPSAAPKPAAPKAPAPPAAPGPVTRPSGQVYRPRVLAGMADVEALRTLRAEGVPSLLSGPPGTGKTSLVEAAFPDLITVAGDGDTTVGDFVGEYTQKPDGTYEFIYGPLVRAMQEGRVLFIDDATLISPAVLAVCYPAMDGRREVIVKAHKGETITAADGFYVVAGHNPGVHGAILTEALSSRFTFQFDVSTDYDLARSLGIDSRAITAARNLATRQANGETGWALQLRWRTMAPAGSRYRRCRRRRGQGHRSRRRAAPRGPPGPREHARHGDVALEPDLPGRGLRPRRHGQHLPHRRRGGHRPRQWHRVRPRRRAVDHRPVAGAPGRGRDALRDDLSQLLQAGQSGLALRRDGQVRLRAGDGLRRDGGVHHAEIGVDQRERRPSGLVRPVILAIKKERAASSLSRRPVLIAGSYLRARS